MSQFIYLPGGIQAVRTQHQLDDGQGNAFPQQGNIQGTVLPSATRTATNNSPVQTNYNARGVLVTLNVTVASGTGGLTLRIQVQDPVSGTFFNYNAAPTSVTATGTYSYLLYPGVSGGFTTQLTPVVLPRTWQVVVSHGDATSYTYSVGYSLIL